MRGVRPRIRARSHDRPIRDRRGLRDFDVAVGRFGEPTGYMTARICAGSAVTRLWPPTEMSKRIVS